MPICPSCGYENLPGSLLCNRCYTLLTPVSKDGVEASTVSSKKASLNASTPLPSTQMDSHRIKYLNMLSDTKVAIFVANQEQPIIFEVDNQVALGRYSQGVHSQPLIDLTGFGALEHGVSRMHVMLRRTDDGFIIEDLSSSNGTWVDGLRLPPFTPLQIRSGQRITLGQLELAFYFRIRVLSQPNVDTSQTSTTSAQDNLATSAFQNKEQSSESTTIITSPSISDEITSAPSSTALTVPTPIEPKTDAINDDIKPNQSTS